MLIKWIFNILLIIWIYTAFVRPLLQGYFSTPRRSRNDSSPRAQQPDDANGQVIIQPKRKLSKRDDDDYIDFEEVK